MKKKIVYIDMDGVLCNFVKAYLNDLEKCPTQKYPQSQFGFFIKLEEIPGAIKAFKKLEEYFEVRILTRPSIYNLNSYTEKAYWVLEHLGFETLEKLDMSCDKSLHIGDYLIDDTDKDGQLNFNGEFIKFGSEDFPNWEYIVEYLLQKEKIPIKSFGQFNENLNISDVGVSLPSVKDWSDIQEEAYDECMDELINDDAPITAFIEWLQKKYPNGVKVN